MIAVEGRQAHQPMNSFFGLEVAIGRLAINLQRGALYARFFALREVKHLSMIAVSLGPAQVHSQQHLAPVLGVNASSARLYRKDGWAVVIRAGEGKLDLFVLQHPEEALRLLAELFLQGGILLAERQVH